MSPISAYEYRQIDAAPDHQANTLGELIGCGPPWVCDSYGLPGHNYFDCQHCQDRFFARLK